MGSAQTWEKKTFRTTLKNLLADAHDIGNTEISEQAAALFTRLESLNLGVIVETATGHGITILTPEQVRELALVHWMASVLHKRGELNEERLELAYEHVKDVPELMPQDVAEVMAESIVQLEAQDNLEALASEWGDEWEAHRQAQREKQAAEFEARWEAWMRAQEEGAS